MNNITLNKGILTIIEKNENKIDQNTFYYITLKPEN